MTFCGLFYLLLEQVYVIKYTDTTITPTIKLSRGGIAICSKKWPFVTDMGRSFFKLILRSVYLCPVDFEYIFPHKVSSESTTTFTKNPRR